jgi:hypothetical protein
MNLLLSFVHFNRAPKQVGPFQAIRLDAETMRDAEDGELIALHREHQWQVGGERYYRVDVTSRVRVHFERSGAIAPALPRSRDFGPYRQFSAVDGIAYADERVFAFVDGRVGDWFCYDDGRHWPVMIVTDAGAKLPLGSLLALLAGLAPLAQGVVAIWRGPVLQYLGRARSLRTRLRSLAEQPALCDAVSAVTWEPHADPAAREAELLAEYESASPSLAATYGPLHGTFVRTHRLGKQAAAARRRARATRDRARRIREACAPA